MSKEEYFEYEGLGDNHKKHCVRPFSILDDISISAFATTGWVKPPTTNAVLSISKLASPDTIHIEKY
jgi:hypothetical protein